MNAVGLFSQEKPVERKEQYFYQRTAKAVQSVVKTFGNEIGMQKFNQMSSPLFKEEKFRHLFPNLKSFLKGDAFFEIDDEFTANGFKLVSLSPNPHVTAVHYSRYFVEI